jgi:hypothetical protein
MTTLPKSARAKKTLVEKFSRVEESRLEPTWNQKNRILTILWNRPFQLIMICMYCFFFTQICRRMNYVKQPKAQLAFHALIGFYSSGARLSIVWIISFPLEFAIGLVLAVWLDFGARDV